MKVLTKLYIHRSPVHRFDGMHMIYGARHQHDVESSRFTSVKNEGSTAVTYREAEVKEHTL